MAIKRVSRPVSLVFVNAAAATKTFAELQSAEVEDSRELPEFLSGNSLVDSHYQGKRTASISVETGNLVDWVGLNVGDKVTGIVLTAEAAIDSGGVAAGQNVSRTMSKGIVSEVTQPSLSNSDKKPVTVKFKIMLSKHEGDTDDPTFGAWTAVT